MSNDIRFALQQAGRSEPRLKVERQRPPYTSQKTEPAPVVLRDPNETVTAVIPTIPTRRELLQRALASVHAQTSPVDAIAISYDLHHQGAWTNRWNATQTVKTKWLAYLDDDDEWY